MEEATTQRKAVLLVLITLALILVLWAQPAAPGMSSRFSFVAAGDALIHFIDPGFNLVSLANNHALDRREKAVLRSLKYWSGDRNVLPAGSYSSQADRDEIRAVETNGLTCAFLAYTTLT